MRLLGTVKCKRGTSRLLVSAACCPSEGDKVFDARGRGVGTVRMVFGNVRQPYVTVEMNRATGGSGLSGTELYIMDVKEDDGGKRSERRH
ncbi:MAG: hypothetical protein QXP70_01525 [Methanomassiliicoccales archaeon]